MNRKPIITVDGPAGAGKSTISKMLAEHMSFVYLDTGALYRALAYKLRAVAGSEEADERLMALECRSLKVVLKNHLGSFRVIVDGEDVTDKIRSEEIGLIASRISAIPTVREKLLSVQRDVGRDGGIVAEGRDMGTVVFPNAEIKFFLDASVEERANRRYVELVGKNTCVAFDDVKNDLILRDRQDTERSIAPLEIPRGAVVVDSSDKSVPEVLDIMTGIIKKSYSIGKGFVKKL